jgi:hypothetical protein
MHKFILSFVVLFIVAVTSYAGITVDSCEFYAELETKHSCGPYGYIQKFASPYCESYLQRKEDFSPQGQMILRNIRLCLQEVLAPVASVMSCDEIQKFGISSHEYCYVDGGFCELKGMDRLRVFWIARAEAFNVAVWDLMMKVNKACILDRKDRYLNIKTKVRHNFWSR